MNRLRIQTSSRNILWSILKLSHTVKIEFAQFFIFLLRFLKFSTINLKQQTKLIDFPPHIITKNLSNFLFNFSYLSSVFVFHSHQIWANQNQTKLFVSTENSTTFTSSSLQNHSLHLTFICFLCNLIFTWDELIHSFDLIKKILSFNQQT